MASDVREEVHLRNAINHDLQDINAVVEAAVMNWRLPERIKRLALPSYRYSELDCDHIQFIIAEARQHGIVGVAACEIADPGELPGKKALLLHGLYVYPEMQHRGVGTLLFNRVEALVLKRGCDGLLVKAQADAAGFFEHQGMWKLETDKPHHDYAHRFWKPGHLMSKSRLDI